MQPFLGREYIFTTALVEDSYRYVLGCGLPPERPYANVKAIEVMKTPLESLRETCPGLVIEHTLDARWFDADSVRELVALRRTVRMPWVVRGVLSGSRYFRQDSRHARRAQ